MRTLKAIVKKMISKAPKTFILGALALGIMIDTRCILALAGALYSLFVISNLYILSRFSDAILMYFPIFFINSSHPINEQ